MNRNVIAAVILSIIVLYVWGEFFAPKPPAPPEEPASSGSEPVPREKSEQSLAPDTTPSPSPQSSQPVGESLFQKGTLSATTQNPLQEGTLSGSSVRARYSTEKGRLTAIAVTGEKYREKNLDMLAALAPNAIFPEISSLFETEPSYLVEQIDPTTVLFRYDDQGVTETKTIRITGDYLFTVTKKVKNNRTSPIEWRPALRYRSVHENKEVFSSYGKQFEFLLKTVDEGLKEPSSGEKLAEAVQGKSIQWVGINYGFFLYAVIADTAPLSVEGVIDSKENVTTLTTAYAPITLAPGQEAEASFTLFLGPKEIRVLEEAGHDLRSSTSLGWFGFLAEPLLWVLTFFYDFVKNYGIAIILLTILVKVLLWPLSDASYKSMAKMKKLMPKVEELKKKYKEDKETLNKEIMLLYQKEGVNPLGGCLPIFIQLPIYIALYSMLNNAVELYNAKFLPFWLTDLSEKDPYFILPLLLGVFMFLQQKMTPSQVDNQQAKIMLYIMPVMFTGFMLFLPSGLNLYILVNMLLEVSVHCSLVVNK